MDTKRYGLAVTGLLIMALALIAPVCAEPVWQPSVVDSSGPFQHLSIAMNQSGYTGISYGSSTLMYAESSGYGWEITPVDNPGGTITSTSLALNPPGNPRIVYETLAGTVMYAERTGTVWTLTTVTSPVSGAYPSLALDSSGIPGIAYRNGAGNLAYAEWNGAGWTITTVGAGQRPSLAFDPAGNPRIAYRDGSRNVHLLERNGMVWTDTTVEVDPGFTYICGGKIAPFYGPVLAHDPAGDPAIVYSRCVEFNNLAVMYANRTGSAWTVTTVVNNDAQASVPSLAFTPDGFPGISYLNRTSYLTYTSSDGASWTRTNVDPVVISCGENPLAIVPGAAGIAYREMISDSVDVLHYAKKSSGLPRAGFTASPTGGNAPLTVALTDTSTNEPGGWQWNFGSYSASDGGVSDLRNPTHVYSIPGTYTVSSAVRNANGGTSVTRVGYITVTDAGSGGGSGGSGGSGSGSGFGSSGGGSSSGGSDSDFGPAPGPGTTGTYEANVGGNSAVRTVTVTGTGVNSVIITGMQQGSLPPGVPPVDPDTYQYIELAPARAGSITGATISFEVPVSWLEEHHLTTGDVSMNRYQDGAWTTLPTTYLGTANGIARYSAQSPGFSLFAIAPKKGGATTGPAPGACPVTQQLTCPACPACTGSGATVLSSGAVPATQAPAAGSVLPEPGFPFATIALIGAGCIALIGGGWYVRRWYIRRQNPALFEEY